MRGTLTDYIAAALRYATVERLADGIWFAAIPPLPGVWADGADAAACRAALQSVLEDWLLVGLRHDAEIPVLDGLSLAVRGPGEGEG